MKELFKSIVVCKIKITDYMGNEEEITVHIDEEVDKDGLWGYHAEDFRKYIEHSLVSLRNSHRAKKIKKENQLKEVKK